MKMIELIIIVIAIFLAPGGYGQGIPFNVTPDWESNPNQHVATGLGLADINGDGFKDLVAANGNDIYRQRLVVYYNNGTGGFPDDPSWQSGDIDYHGHLSCGDVDSDGDADVAVSVYLGASGFSSPGKVKVYYNLGNELESFPSFQSSPFYTFSCALGDADADGDLDLAAAAGEPYSNQLDYGKVFINQGGYFSPDADWQSEIAMGALDVEFGDIDRNGYLDLVFICEGTPNCIYLAGPGGEISESPSWQSGETENFLNSLDIGYTSGHCQVVMTENDQLGGLGRVRLYNFGETIPPSSVADWYSPYFGYGSGIFLMDADVDGVLDLVYGGWWLPVIIALGSTSGFEEDPSYISLTSSVVEAIQFADLGGEGIQEEAFAFTAGPEMNGKHTIILPRQVVDEILTVSRDGISLPPGGYSWAVGKPWISLADPMATGSNYEIIMGVSSYPDMVVTNWDSSKGNYIFYNTVQVGLGEHNEWTQAVSLRIFPNPSSGREPITVDKASPGEYVAEILDLTGRQVYSQDICVAPSGNKVTIGLPELPEGTYILLLKGDRHMSAGLFLVH